MDQLPGRGRALAALRKRMNSWIGASSRFVMGQSNPGNSARRLRPRSDISSEPKQPLLPGTLGWPQQQVLRDCRYRRRRVLTKGYGHLKSSRDYSRGAVAHVSTTSSGCHVWRTIRLTAGNVRSRIVNSSTMQIHRCLAERYTRLKKVDNGVNRQRSERNFVLIVETHSAIPRKLSAVPVCRRQIVCNGRKLISANNGSSARSCWSSPIGDVTSIYRIFARV